MAEFTATATAKYHAISELRAMDGLRLVLHAGVPGPWSEACKSIFDVKGLSYARGSQDIGGPNEELKAWTAQTSAPVAIWADERPRSTWLEQLYLAERLNPEPRLIPEDIDDRVTMIGLINELVGEKGFGWSKRLIQLEQVRKESIEGLDAFTQGIGKKYGYDPNGIGPAIHQAATIMKRLSDQLAEQSARGSRFLIGDSLSALDIYWAAFAVHILPLPQEYCAMPDEVRKTYTNSDPTIAAAVSPELLAHRDFIYREYLVLPLEL